MANIIAYFYKEALHWSAQKTPRAWKTTGETKVDVFNVFPYLKKKEKKKEKKFSSFSKSKTTIQKIITTRCKPLVTIKNRKAQIRLYQHLVMSVILDFRQSVNVMEFSCKYIYIKKRENLSSCLWPNERLYKNGYNFLTINAILF